MSSAILILYVADQGRSRSFYSHLLGALPSLDVPGMSVGYGLDPDGHVLAIAQQD